MTDAPMTKEQYEHGMRVWEANGNRRTALFSAHISAIATFASLAINAVILGNSASAGAVLALLGTMWGKEEAAAVAGPAITSIAIFAFGVWAAMVAAATSYIAQYCYSHSDRISIDPNGTETPEFKRHFKTGRLFHLIAFVFGICGIVSFGIGAWIGIHALMAANGGAPGH